MRNYPENEYDLKELEKLNAEDWQIEMLKKNPEYVYWGNYEDYMASKNGGWSNPIELNSVKELWELDELNELVNFYFGLNRENHECKECEGTGLNKETKQLSDDWYDFEGTGRKWSNKLNQHEVDVLWEVGRLHCDFKEKPTADEVNRKERKVFLHEAINRSHCIETRAKDLGIYGYCKYCNGEGYIYDEPKAKLYLQMWFLHPRKGCSRGVLLKEIKRDEIEEVLGYLKEARQRNYDRFSKL